MSAHLSQQQAFWAAVENIVSSGTEVILDGNSVTRAQVIAVSDHGAPFSISSDAATSMSNGVHTLHQKLENQQTIYGVNTGPGGNADTRTDDHHRLQCAFFQHQQSGILLPVKPTAGSCEGFAECLPVSVVRGLVLVRCNSLVRGHSGVRRDVIQRMLDLSRRGVTPIIPLRGSISASGDLSPLSYIGGLLEGNPATYARVQEGPGIAKFTTAEKALADLGMSPLVMEPKEALAIMNGTSVSVAYAALALSHCQELAILCQLLTAMTTEALLGKIANYHPFIFKVRPHSGSIEAARNITMFLDRSKLCKASGGAHSSGLAQDRYALRTAAQWIGPQLEDLALADQQLNIELNSSTDNPLIEAETGTIHHGGNFQAASVTSAMEKARNSTVMLGRLVLAQVGELVNPDLNNGLTPNLCADEPSVSFTCKGADINVTAYYSELAFLANSVASHVQTAELGNQSVNSLALIAARMTDRATELLSMMLATQIYVVCQALDLRAREEDFLSTAKHTTWTLFTESFSSSLENGCGEDIFESVWKCATDSWRANSRLDGKERCNAATRASAAVLLESSACVSGKSPVITMENLSQWRENQASTLLAAWQSTQKEFSAVQTTPGYLGKATLGLYTYVRSEIEIPFHQGIEDHPAFKGSDGDCGKLTIGGYVSRIYEAIRDGRLFRVVRTSLPEYKDT